MRKLSDNPVFYYPPIPAASFLNLSHKNYIEAERLYKEVLQKKNSLGVLPDVETIDLLELRMTSIVFAYTSLEAFANEEVPDNYVYAIAEKNCTRHFNKDQIERFLNLDTKLGDVLPTVLGVKTPKGNKLWNAYIELGRLRDCIVHMKTNGKIRVGGQSNTIWNTLLYDFLPPYKTAKDLMKYFFDAKKKSPAWFKGCPF
jgi:hypothetical protein